MALDGTGQLKGFVQSFSQEQTVAGRKALVSQILYLWAGQSNTVPGSRGAAIDARQVGVLESFWGFAALQQKPSGVYAENLKAVYQQLELSVYSQLMTSGAFKDEFSLVKYSQSGGQGAYDFTYLSSAFALRVSQGDPLVVNELKDAIDIVAGLNPYDSSIKEQFLSSLEASAEYLSATDRHVLFGVIRSGNDQIQGSDQADIIRGYAGNDTISGGAGDDFIYGNEGNDVLRGGAGNDVLLGNEGDNTLYGEAGDDSLFGGEGRDTLYGGAGDDILAAGSGQNILYGEGGDDVIFAGEGEATLSGGDGSDVYVFSAGNGNTKIDNLRGGDGSIDKLIIDDYVFDDLSFKRNSDDLVVSIKETGKTITVKNYFRDDANGAYVLNAIGLAKDGTILDVAAIKDLVQVPSAEADRLYGYSGADVLSGLEGNDSIYGGAGDDVLNGNEGKDRLDGGSGNDTLSGGDGNDTLIGGSGNDVLTGGHGNDYLEGGDGSNSYFFSRGDGQDTILDSYENVLDLHLSDLSPENLVVRRVGDGVELTFSDSAGDKLQLNKFLRQETPANSVRINYGEGQILILDPNQLLALALSGTNGSDNTQGFASNDLIDALDGNDFVDGRAGDDSLAGGAGNDTLLGGEGNDLLNGGSGNDRLEGGGGSDQYHLAAQWGSDVIIDSAGSDSVRFSGVAPTDLLLRRDGLNLVVVNQATGDQLRIQGQFSYEAGVPGATAIEQFVFDDAITWDYEAIKLKALDGTGQDDTIYGHADDDVIGAGAGNDVVYGQDGNDQIHGGEGTDSLHGGDGNDLLSGEAGDDVLNGGAGNDSLSGGAGNDTLQAGAGNDLLEGGAGNDLLEGGAGDDQYRLTTAWGTDVIIDSAGSDSIRFTDIAPADLLLRRDGDDLVVVNQATGEQLRIQGQFSHLAGSAGTTAIEQFVFDGDVTWDYETIKLRALDGTEQDDIIYGHADDDAIEAGAGNDLVYGQKGNDQIRGGEGADTLHGGDGGDLLSGEAGDDVLNGDLGEDSLQGGDGNDILRAGDGDDLLEGGAGNDRLEGDRGNDNYHLAAGWGSDVVFDSEGTDSVRFTGVAPADLLLRRDDSDLVVLNRATGDQLRIQGQFSSEAGVPGATAVEQFMFDGDIAWDYESIRLKALEGTAQDDSIYGHADDDVIDSGAGNDLVYGQDGDDDIHGGEGADTLHGGNGNDLLAGEAGDDVLDGGSGDDTLYGAEGDDLLIGGGGFDQLDGGAGNDTLQGYGLLEGNDGDDLLEGSGELLGGAGNDTLKGQGFDTLQGGAGDDVLEAYNNAWNQGSNTLEGGAGNDTIYGSFGEDTYVFNLGDGHDLLIERRPNEAYSNIEPTADTLSFGEGIAAGDLSFHRRGLDMIIEHANGTDSITVQNWFQEPTDHFKLEHLLFADGSSLSQADVENRVIWHGTSGADSFIGYRDLGDNIRLGAGDDKAWGRVGDDVIYGEAGNDYLEGEAGSDEIHGGDGNDQLDGGLGGDLLLGGAGDDKYVYSLGDGADVIDNTGGGNDGVFFSGGIDEARLTFTRDGDDLFILVDDDPEQSVRVLGHFLGGDKAISYVQPDGGFLINASRIAQIVAAGDVPGGFDTLVEGTAAGEQLAGGQGRDMLRGLAGNDTLFGMGGDDQVEGGDGDDYLSGGNGQLGGSGNDLLDGGAGNDILAGEDGNDTLIGGAGDDDYYYRANGGVDVIDNSGGGFDGVFFLDVSRSRLSFHRDGDDLVVLVDGDLGQQVRVTNHFLGGDHSIDYVQPDGGNYLTTAQIAAQLTAMPDGGGEEPGEPGEPGEPTEPGNPGGSGEPPAAGVGGDDLLVGTAGNDILLGGAGDDTLSGVAGNDILLGGVGDDTYIYTAGQDVIEEVGGADTLVFAGGIIFNQVASGLMKSGNDLVLRVNGSTANQVTLKNFFLGGDNLVETIAFETGGQLTAAQIFGAFGLPVPTPATAFDDIIQGSIGDDALDGTIGNDLLQGGNGDDELFGDTGADRLEGGNGNDVLAGSAGNDTLLGGRGGDTYVFAAGGGQDVIDNSGGGADTLRFEGISFNQVASGLMKSGNDLVLNVSGGSDKVTIRNWFLGGDYVVDTIAFASGGQITADQLFGAFGLSNPDPLGSPTYRHLPDERSFGTVLAGQAGNQIILGSSDDDLIDGGAGNDTLRGNTGNDYLIGGAGSDTYVFAAGDGQDVINNLSNTPDTDSDVLSIADIGRENLWLSRQGDDLVIDVTGSEDRITIQDWYADPAQQLDVIQAGSASLYANQVDNLVNAMAAFGAPAGDEINLTSAQREQLNTIIATNWQ